MPFDRGYSPTYNGFIRFHTGSFALSRSVDFVNVQDKLFHNIEWLWGNSSQIRINWSNINGFTVGNPGVRISSTTGSFLFSDGPFLLSLMADGTPMPLYVRIDCGPSHSSPGVSVSADVTVHLRQQGSFGEMFFASEIGTFSVTGVNDSRRVYELTTPSSSLSTSSSLLELLPGNIKPLFQIATRNTRSISEANSKVDVLLCWLDFYAIADPSSKAEVLRFYSVFAQEFVPAVDEI